MTGGDVTAGRILDLDVGAPAHGGSCVARHEGRVVFVRHALPGERVRARVTEGRPGARYLRADAIEVLRASADRVVPPCPYAGRCGGCDWQHATPEAQRRIKARIVEEQLRRLAGLDLSVTVEPLPGDPRGLGWRTRVRFAVDGDGRVGLHPHRSHDVVPVAACPIAHPAVEALGVEGTRWPGAAAVDVTASATTGEWAVVVDRRPEATHHDYRSGVRSPGGRVHVRGDRREPRPVLHETSAGRRWQVGTGFWQVHPAAADALVEAVVTALAPRDGDRALDLYAGVGLFAGVLAGRVGPKGSVVAVESDREAAAHAAANLADEPAVRVEPGRVDRVLARLAPAKADIVVLDPPRTGARAAVVGAVARLRPRAVAYVACDPAALARDLGYFQEWGYTLRALRAFDSFPMTHHVECVAALVRTPGSPDDSTVTD